jgi:hypothetical protein
MNFIETEPRASKVSIRNEQLNVQLIDGRTVTVPLSWFPRLSKATAAQRLNFRLIGGGVGIHWPDVDEDLSIAGVLKGNPSFEAANTIAPAFSAKGAQQQMSKAGTGLTALTAMLDAETQVGSLFDNLALLTRSPHYQAAIYAPPPEQSRQRA